MTIPTRRLGANAPLMPAIGLGCMRMSDIPQQRTECIATIRAALDSGISFLDTGDFYGMGHNEMLIGEAIRGRREQAFISVKYGGLRDPAGAFLGFNADYNATMSFLAYSLQRLGTDYIDLYQPARIYPHVPFDETMRALTEAVRRGYVRYIGLSEVGPETIRRATAVHPIVAIEAEYSLMDREIESSVIPAARAAGAGVVAYGVLTAGLLGGRMGPDTKGDGPRFDGENLRKNLALVERVKVVASDLGASPAQLAIAWVLARGNDILPLIGARSRSRLEEALGALELKLGPTEMAAIDEACPPGELVGDYYGGPVREHIVAERRQRPSGDG